MGFDTGVNFGTAQLTQPLSATTGVVMEIVMDSNNYTLKRQSDGSLITQGYLLVIQKNDSRVKELVMSNQIEDISTSKDDGRVTYRLNIASTPSGKLMRGIINDPNGTIADDQIAEDNITNVDFLTNSTVRMTIGIGDLKALSQNLVILFDDLAEDIQDQQDSFEVSMNAQYVTFSNTITDQQNDFENTVKTSIDEKAMDLLITLSEGYPHFIQQFGYCAFDIDEDGTITQDDVYNGAFGRNGALEKIGDGYYRDNFYNKIGLNLQEVEI